MAIQKVKNKNGEWVIVSGVNKPLTIDSLLSDTSENPVKGRAIKEYIDYSIQNVEIDVDSELSDTSENPVQNKAIKEYIDNNVFNDLNERKADKDEVTAKQDKINDLDTIRSGAAKGATAIQQVKTINGEEIVGEGNIEINVDTSTLATKEEVTNLINEVIDDEEVLAHSLNELNERVLNIAEELTGDFASKEEFDSALESLSQADTTNQQAISEVSGKVTTLTERVDNITAELADDFATKEDLETSNSNLTNELINDEEVLAHAINDLNNRVNELAENVSGEAATKVELADAVSTINATINANDERYEGEFSALDDRIDELAANVSGETVTKVEFEETVTNLTNEVIDDEEVLAHAINDLNERLEALTARITTLESNNA